MAIRHDAYFAGGSEIPYTLTNQNAYTGFHDNVITALSQIDRDALPDRSCDTHIYGLHRVTARVILSYVQEGKAKGEPLSRRFSRKSWAMVAQPTETSKHFKQPQATFLSVNDTPVDCWVRRANDEIGTTRAGEDPVCVRS